MRTPSKLFSSCKYCSKTQTGNRKATVSSYMSMVFMQVRGPEYPTLNCIWIIIQKILPGMPDKREMLAERKEGRRKEGKSKGRERRALGRV